MKTMIRIALICVLLSQGMLSAAHAARLKDIADVEGVRGNQLFGYGLVVGLNGTGDGNATDFTTKSLANMVERLGIQVDPNDVKVKNVAAVMVTAELPAFARPGLKLDITLSSLGDAKSLTGGQLIFTPLKGADGNVYAVAQGAVSVGGFSIQSGNDSAIQNHPTVGQISEGAIVERAIAFDLFQSKRVRIVLRKPDFTTMTRVVESINDELRKPLALAIDAASVEVPLLEDFGRDPIALVARIEQVEVEQDRSAIVVVNEKTGTIVMGENVTVGKVALAHGALNIAIRSETQVSQPEQLAERGNTEVVTNDDITVGEEVRQLSMVGGRVTLGEVI
ncbi:MAG: flagellar basal body P-ring protein FlgI, partial [Bdellovibrionales bacterium]|nr:flagellar basal body P-ring protein FlgI [Bdellovibrionales bacterium]